MSNGGERDGRAAAIAAACGVAGAAIALALRRLGDYDLPWHLATGRTLIDTGAIPARDPFTFLHPPLGGLEVVSDSFLYLVWRAGGELGLQLVPALAVIAIALALRRAGRTLGALTWFAIGLALAAMNAWLLARPATIGFVLCALAIAAIEGHRRTPDRTSGVVGLAMLVPLQIVWANSHGSVTLGLLLAAGYAVYRVGCRVAAGRLGPLLPAADGRGAVFAVAVAAAAALASGLNTSGFAILGAANTAEAAPMFTEWTRTSLEFLFVIEPATGALLAVAAAALAFGRNPDGTRVPGGWDLGLCALGFALAFSAVRLIAFAAVLLAVPIARRLAGVAPPRARVRWLAASALLLLGPLMLFRHYTSLGVGFEPTHFPDASIAYVRAAKPQGRMWNFLPFGGYLIWRLHPEHLAFIDGRTGWIHGLDIVRRAHASALDDDAFARLADDLDLEWAVTVSREGEPFGGPLARSPAWTMVQFDDVGAVYVRTAGPNAALAADGYRVFRHTVPLPALLALAVRGQRAADLVHDGDLAVRQAPTSPRAAFVAACAGIAARDRARFDAARAHLVDLAGASHPAVRELDAAWRR